MSLDADRGPAAAAAAVGQRGRGRGAALGLLLGGVLGLVALELALRVWVAWDHPPLYTLDGRLGWLHTPGLDRALVNEDGVPIRLRTDARGLRATPYPDELRGGTRRVLVLGDSFTEGSQVEDDDLFTTQVARELPGTEVWNTGVGAWGTVQQLLWLRDAGMALGPELVVLVVFDNDFVDNLMPYYAGIGPRPWARLDAEGGVRIEESLDAEPVLRFLLPVPGRWWWYRHSALYNSLHKNLFLPMRKQELERLEFQERAAVAQDDARAVMRELLARMASLARSGGARLVVVAIPSREQAAAGLAPDQDWLQARCAELDLPFLPLLGVLAPKAGEAEPAYFRHDIHFTASGHARVARALVPFLRGALDLD